VIKRDDLQFVAYLHQKHRFTSPVRTAIHALKWSSKHGNQSLLINLYCARCFVKKQKWIDAPILICDESHFWQQTICTILLILLLWRCLLVGVHSQCMLGNLTQCRKLRSLSANQIGIR